MLFLGGVVSFCRLSSRLFFSPSSATLTKPAKGREKRNLISELSPSLSSPPLSPLLRCPSSSSSTFAVLRLLPPPPSFPFNSIGFPGKMRRRRCFYRGNQRPTTFCSGEMYPTVQFTIVGTFLLRCNTRNTLTILVLHIKYNCSITSFLVLQFL